jgi:hypothetical protein
MLFVMDATGVSSVAAVVRFEYQIRGGDAIESRASKKRVIRFPVV